MAAGLAAVGAASAATVTTGSVGITDRLVAGRLAGLSAVGAPRAFTTATATVAALDSDTPKADLAAYRKAGFQRAALRRFGNGQTTFGMSLVIQVGSHASALVELARNVAVIRRGAANPPKGTTGRVITLMRIPGSTAFAEHFQENGKPIEFAGALFADGPYVYLVTAGGPDATLDEQAVYDASVALYRRVQGR